ncbi:hypothetical protein [Aquimarina sp. RZ0]|uniref:hypothetical protein n=1 Tax=Aquimarina sp. RZ0 TaxID=2607730 RepID=UPI0011F25965|nr:hypothetical protein [Aquimarina sp. RZ0]KAA1245883.1 hypothetical protein F0000_10005 [Aquimarina sp. RZ0]
MFISKSNICFFFFLTIHITYSQKKDDAIFFIQQDQISKFHTISDLEDLKKGELIKLYQDRVQEIITVIPFLSLTNEPGVRLEDIGIKEDANHLKMMKKNNETTRESLQVTKQSIEELVAYADTEKIIWTILYFEEVIKKMRIGVKGNF